MSERTATILYGDELRDGKPKWANDSMLPDRAGLARHLGKYDIQLKVATVRPESGDFDVIDDPHFSEAGELEIGHTEQISSRDLGQAILDRHTLAYGQKERHFTTPQVNETAVQAYGADKFAAYRDIHGHLPEAILTFLLSEIEQHLDDIEDGPFIVKPIKGALGVGLKAFGSKDDLRSWALQQPSDVIRRYIFQPKYDLTGPLPGLKPYSESDAGEFYAANNSDLPKEVRIYTMFNAASNTLRQSAVPRYNVLNPITDRGDDEWFFADQASLLERLAQPASEVAERLAKATGVVAVYIAVDFGFGGRNTEDPNWRLIEANTRFPYLLSEKEHPELGARVHGQFAQHVHELIDKSMS